MPTHISIQPIECVICADPMRGIFHASIRNTCTPCGGHSLIDNDAVREEIHREHLAKVREARQH